MTYLFKGLLFFSHIQSDMQRRQHAAFSQLVLQWKMCAQWKNTRGDPAVTQSYRCGVLKSPFRRSILLYRAVVCISYTMSGKQVHFESINDPMCLFYLHVDAPVCLYAYVRVWGGMFVFECDSVYFVSPRTLRLSVCCSLWWEHTYVFAWRPGSMWVFVW